MAEQRSEVAAAAIILPFRGKEPRIHPGAWVAPGAAVVGDVTLGEGSSIWYGVVVRGDVHHVRIGTNTNIQDQAVVHVTAQRHPAEIGDRVTVGHRAVVHGCRVANEALVGIAAVVLDGAEVGEGAWVGAGAVVTPGSVIPAGTLALGAPARVVRELREEERRLQSERTLEYVKTAREHARAAREADLAGRASGSRGR